MWRGREHGSAVTEVKEEGTELSGAVVIGGCELINVLGTELRSAARAVPVLISHPHFYL